MNAPPSTLHPPPAWPGVIRHYAPFLPVSAATPVVTLLEGNTPLIPAQRFVEAIGGKFLLYLKYEALNPTCSFKDRGMTLAVSKAKERGAQVVICASTGNTSASAAAYAARAGMKCVVLLPKGQRSVDQWFNVNAFALPAQFTYGTSGLFVINAPGRYNWDLALQKDFRILERHTLQFRAESYNLPNSVSLGNPSVAYDGNNFGRVTSATAARQLQFALRYQF